MGIPQYSVEQLFWSLPLPSRYQQPANQKAVMIWNTKFCSAETFTGVQYFCGQIHTLPDPSCLHVHFCYTFRFSRKSNKASSVWEAQHQLCLETLCLYLIRAVWIQSQSRFIYCSTVLLFYLIHILITVASYRISVYSFEDESVLRTVQSFQTHKHVIHWRSLNSNVCYECFNV